MESSSIDSHAKGTAPSEEDAASSVTLFELSRPVNRRAQLRRTPRLALDAVRMVWQASPVT